MYFSILDLLRFFSAIAVLFHHTFAFHYGKLGVYLFFIISGFVIYFSLNKGIKEYALGRFLRLFPLFWVCCTLTYLVTMYYDVNLPLKNYLVSMLLINDGKIAQLVDGSYWTLTFEVLFYVYIGIFVWLFSAKRLEWFYGIWLLIAFLAFFFGFDQHIIAKLLCLRFAPYFVFGGVLALVVDRYKQSSFSLQVVYAGLLGISALLPLYISKKLLEQKDTISNFTGSFLGREMYIVESFFVIVPLVVYFSYASFATTKKFTKLCYILGGITYPLYLLHWKIGETVVNQFGKYSEVNLGTVSVAAGLILVSWFLSVHELPLRKALKRVLERCI